jgi:hypothetical protein
MRARRSAGALLAFFGGLVVAGILPAVSPQPALAKLQHGFSGGFASTDPPVAQSAAIVEIGTKLRATMIRIDVLWSLAEPERGVYDDAGYLAATASAVDTARANGMQPVVMVDMVPQWASDSSFWDNPPAGIAAGYQPFYPMSPSALEDFQRFATHLSTMLKGRVLAYECWNEPNMWTYLYPQRTGGDRLFGAHTYVRYLKSFSPGIRAGDPDAMVLAGATAPFGENNSLRSSPQRFAQVIRDSRVNSLFDGYSHHPYCVGGRKNLDPSRRPASPGIAIETGNISTLLKMFPRKPFYLTEFGYNTAYTTYFGARVSEVKQATYLTKSFALMARHPQIKVLMWYQLRDVSPTNVYSDSRGIYMGLRDLGGEAKRAWYAYARGNRITLAAPARAHRGSKVRLNGIFTCATVGGVAGESLLLQAKRGRRPWASVRSVTTGADGSYVTFVRLKRSTRFRLVFKGVVSSPSRLVRTK